MKTAPAPARLACAALLALLLALRMLAPPGFMPSFAAGTIAIVACPDAAPAAAAMPAGHHHDPKKLHQECPYASAAGVDSLAPIVATLVDVVVLAVAIVLGRTFLFLERSRAHERPPLRGPPIPA